MAVRSDTSRFSGFVLAICLSVSLAYGSESEFESDVRPLLRQHCVRCHGGDEATEGEVDLVSLRWERLSERPEFIETLIDVLELGEMPPQDEPPLAEGIREQSVATLKRLLRQSVSQATSHRRTPIRRMNRFQYSNAVEDLFELNCVVFSLPEKMMREHRGYFQPQSRKMPDTVVVGSRPLGKSQMIEKRLGGVAAFPQDLRAEHGFDNRADHLSLSPLLLEAFLRTSQSIVHSPDFGPKTVGVWESFFAAPPPGSSLEPIVRDRLEAFLVRAFRMPKDEVPIDRYTQFASGLIASGVTFSEAMKETAAAIIASPRFLYLYDRTAETSGSEPSGTEGERAAPLDDFSIASRLSFFLWGSVPDQELLSLAAAGTLGEPDVLAAQVDRMLLDRKVKRFCDSFPAQWLQLERIISSAPDRESFPDFYFSKYRSSMHMMLEPLLLFETVLLEDRPIIELIDPDFSYRSGRLDRLYYRGGNRLSGGRNPVTALTFTRVPITDRREGGVITNAAVMTMTSGVHRTKPITRGAWMATVIFNSPPDPPPADVPPLDETPKADEQQLTLRERLELHRERASCAGCHEKIDPLGFALENYGPTGKWRETYENGRSIDPRGRLFGKHAFEDVAAFKDAIVAEKTRFVRGFAAHLLSFALAREIDASDAVALDQITERSAADHHRLKSMIKQVVLSDGFCH